MEDKKVKAGSVAVGICLFIIAILLVVIVLVFYNSTTVKNNLQAEVDELKISLEEKDKKVETDKFEEKENNNTDVKNLSSINKRLYAVDSGLNPQRYFLLVDDSTYGMEQNFLNKKTYILDLDMTNGNEIVKEIDLAKQLKPFFDEYIEKNKGENEGDFSVEYFGYTTTEADIDFEREVPFVGYYRCVNGNVETSLGFELYVYNVEKKQIRDLGSYN